MIRDRGRIKWTAMMLPEHVQQLRQLQQEQENEVNKAEPDEQQLEEWNYEIATAIERHLSVIVHYWIGNDTVEAKGFIRKIDQVENILFISETEGEVHRIPFTELKSISVSE
ncbi:MULTISPECIES: YolD-like family protein [Sporosarcina]|uniref:YolD-like family protein n=1 Tax=Sporosarcina contaminans TaxID=633403 RepID=A0ABW3TUH5_9BACL